MQQDHDYLALVHQLEEYIANEDKVYQSFLQILVSYLPAKVTKSLYDTQLSEILPEWT